MIAVWQQGLSCHDYHDPIIGKVIHTSGSMIVNYRDMYSWEGLLKTGGEPSAKIQKETNTWGNLLIATEGCLNLEKWCWCLLNYNYVEGVCEPADTVGCKLDITLNSRAPTPMVILDPPDSRKRVDMKNWLGKTRQTWKTSETRWMLGLMKWKTVTCHIPWDGYLTNSSSGEA